MRALRSLPLLLLAPFLLAGPASAAPASPVAKGEVVATDGSLRLTARDDGNALCLGFEQSGATGESCGEPGEGVVTIGQAPGSTRADSPRYVGAAVPAGAAGVEVRRAGRLLASASTVAGEAYRGRRAGEVRFALVRLPEGLSETGLRVRALDADGAPVEVFAPGDGDLVTDRRVLLAGRSGKTRWSIVGQRRSSLSSALFDLDHETVTQCLEARVAGRRSSSSTSVECVGGSPQDSLLDAFGTGKDAAGATTEQVCGTRFRLLHGVVPGRGVAVTARLGDGRRLRARSAFDAGAARTVYAVVVPSGAAIRSLSVRRPGKAAHTVAFSVPPLAVACAPGSPGFDLGSGLDPTFDVLSFFKNLPVVEPEGPVTEVAGSPGFRVADGPEGSLCLAVPDTPFTALGCGIVPPGYAESVGAVDDYRRPRRFVLVVPAQVARVRFGPKGGPYRDLPTVDGAGYAGRYAGRVRFLAASIGSFRELQRQQLLDGSGKVLHTETDTSGPTDATPPKVLAARRIAGAPGRASLWQTPIRTGGTTLRCLALTRGGHPNARTRCRTIRSGPAQALVSASCATRRLTVGLVVSAGSRVRARLSGGVALALPVRAGAAVLTLPRTSGLRSLTVTRRGKSTRTLVVRAPAATEQCGWDAAIDAAIQGPERP